MSSFVKPIFKTKKCRWMDIFVLSKDFLIDILTSCQHVFFHKFFSSLPRSAILRTSISNLRELFPYPSFHMPKPSQSELAQKLSNFPILQTTSSFTLSFSTFLQAISNIPFLIVCNLPLSSRSSTTNEAVLDQPLCFWLCHCYYICTNLSPIVNMLEKVKQLVLIWHSIFTSLD